MRQKANYKENNKSAYSKIKNFINKYQCGSEKVKHGGK